MASARAWVWRLVRCQKEGLRTVSSQCRWLGGTLLAFQRLAATEEKKKVPKLQQLHRPGRQLVTKEVEALKQVVVEIQGREGFNEKALNGQWHFWKARWLFLLAAEKAGLAVRSSSSLRCWDRSENQAKNGRLAFQREVPLVTRPFDPQP